METRGAANYPVAELDSEQRKKLSVMESQFSQETKQSVILIAYQDTKIG